MAYRVKIKRLEAGLGPNAAFVEVQTVDGPVQLEVSERSIESDSIEIGCPVGHTEKAWLVELPRETVQGARRVYVLPQEVVPPVQFTPYPGTVRV